MYYFIVNERGGSGKALKTWKKVRKALDEKNVTYDVLTTSLETTATILARNVSSLDGEINLVVVGGDGTVNEVLNGIGDFEKVRLGVIPTGSGNDFARGLGLPLPPLPRSFSLIYMVIITFFDRIMQVQVRFSTE